MRMAPPPPLVAKRQLPMTVVPPIMTARSGTDKKRRIRWPKEPASVEEEKAVEIKKWKNIIDAIGPEHCRIADQLNTANSEEDQWKTLAAACHDRAASTLRKHAGAINMFMRWCHSTGYQPFPFAETTVWNYVKFLNDTRAPATRADSMIKAAHATIDITTMYVGPSEIATRRIEGAVLQSFDRKRETHQAPPLSVKAVEALERAITSDRLNDTQKILAGFARMCVGASLRNADGTSISTGPVVEPNRVRREKKGYGFLETRAGILKNTQKKGKRRRPIPVATHSWGLVEEGWAQKLLETRKKKGRSADKDGSIMPACGPDWVLIGGTRMSSDTLTISLREILVLMGIERAEAQTYTSHSMKATMLSWAGKCGLKKNIRRVLGRHSKARDSMPELYSRDELAEPLRQLGHVVAWVSSGAFIPDATRSGRWTKHPREASRGLAPGASAADFLAVMAPTNAGTKPTVGHVVTKSRPQEDTPPELGDEISDVERAASDVSEAESEDEERDELEHCAAGVLEDVRLAESEAKDEGTTAPAAAKCYAPLYFKVLRHLYRGTRHWSPDGKNLICPLGAKASFKPDNYREAETHEDAFCDTCIKVAERDFGLSGAREYAHGKVVA